MLWNIGTLGKRKLDKYRSKARNVRKRNNVTPIGTYITNNAILLGLSGNLKIRLVSHQ